MSIVSVRRRLGALALTACAGSLVVEPASAQTPLRLELVASGLQVPVLVTAPRADFERIFIVDKSGRIRIVRDGVLLPTPFLNLASTGLVANAGEMGLLGLAFHPDYANNRRFFVLFSTFPFPSTVLMAYTASAQNPDLADPMSGQVLLQWPGLYGNHNGGMIAFGPDGKLYVSTGDGGSVPPAWANDPLNHAQRGDSLLGKMLRLDVDNVQPPSAYGIPADNPFVGPGDPLDEIWSIGLRNPWRFSFDRLTGDLYIGDVGGVNEEIDFEPPGAGGRNYGWKCLAGTYCNNDPACGCLDPQLTMPLFEYGGFFSHAVIGGYVYRGVAIPDLRGTYFHADYSLVTVGSFRRTPLGVTDVVDRTAELTPPAPQVLVGPTAFGEDAYGELYLCDHSGRVYRIAPVTPSLVGVVPFGVGTPGCSGGHTLSADSSAVIGHPQFALRTTAVPPSGFGVMALASDADPVGSDFGYGILAHLQLSSPFFVMVPYAAGPTGVAEFAFPIPNSATLAGATLHAQSAWEWPASTCAPSFSGWSSSPGLSFTLQP
ncbi:MAG: PQQ-dependent sugar dehydrogenase [Planctomycetes bacterium]|nr:PQQ-dependent sugar dehydrogenase [Planctomycetota bacterium]